MLGRVARFEVQGGCGHGPSAQFNKRVGPNEVMEFRIWPSTELNWERKGQ